jgi:hypothetical protein
MCPVQLDILLMSKNDCYSSAFNIEHTPSQYSCVKMNYLMVYDVVGSIGRIHGLRRIYISVIL